MRFCIKHIDWLSIGLLVWCVGMSAHAESIAVNRAETRLTEEGYQLSADFEVNLTSAAKEALNHGVTLYFVSEFTVTFPRWYWMDGEVARSEQVIKLSYNALTQQYRLGHGALQQGFSSLSSALKVLGHQVATPIPAEAMNHGEGYLSRWIKWLKAGKRYVATAQMRLDVSQLPKPLQVNALAGNDWDIRSEQYHWLIQAESEEKSGGAP